jgi:predicted RNA-binding protein with PUA-like domain
MTSSNLALNSSSNNWLIKSEPESYGIEHLKADKKTPWTGVRNFQARNFMQSTQIGDPVLFYHSSCAVPGIYGLAKVASAPYPDPTQFEKDGDYYDVRATLEKPIWYLVDIAYVRTLAEPLTLMQIRNTPALNTMKILQLGSRLSVTPVTKKEFDLIIKII